MSSSDPKVKMLNPGRKPLTPDKLRELSGLTNLSDHEATQIIFSLTAFAQILYDALKLTDSLYSEEGSVIPMNNNSTSLNSAA